MPRKLKTKLPATRLSDASRTRLNSRPLVVRARYDTAQTTEENRNHWAAADAFSADAANNPGVRMILRNRGRYVFANNSRAKGMIRTIAKHTVGPDGPRLQMMLGSGKQARALNKRITDDFSAWAREIRLAKKLRTIRAAKIVSGEIFVKLVFNPGLNHRVKLDLQLLETDRVCNTAADYSDGNDIDGVFFDEFGNPAYYRVLKVHPGESLRMPLTGPDEYDDVPARFMLHYFEQERPEQHRGVPEITPAVQLVEEGRRFRAAVLGAAETAADFAMAIESQAPADADGAAQIDPMDEIELKRRIATVLPQGWRLTQTKAEQPTTTFKEFSRELLSEVARCLDMPLSMASLDASDANMSSSYIVNQPYENAIEVERGDIETDILDPILDAWLTLAFDPSNGTQLANRIPAAFPHGWFWPLVMEHADPAKRAAGQVARINANLTTLSREYAREGYDWESELEQRSREIKRLEELGIPLQLAMPGMPTPQPNPGDNTDDSEEI